MDGPSRPRSTPKVAYTVHGMLQAIAFVLALDAERLGGGDGTFRPSALYLPAMAVAGVVPFVLGLVLDQRRDRWPDPLPSVVRVLLLAGPVVVLLATEVARGQPPAPALLAGVVLGMLLDQLASAARGLAAGAATLHARRGWRRLSIHDVRRDGRQDRASAASGS